MTDWARAQNRRSNEDLAKSPNKKPFEDWLWNEYGKSHLMQSWPLSDGGVLRLLDKGFGQGMEFRHVRGKASRLIFSTRQLSKKGDLTISKMDLSHDQKTLALSLYEKGSIDDFRVIVIDMDSAKIIRNDLTSSSSTVAWIGKNTLGMNDLATGTFQIWDRRKPGETTSRPGQIWNSNKVWSVRQEAGQVILAHERGVQGILPIPYAQVIGTLRDQPILQTFGDESNFFRARLTGRKSQRDVEMEPLPIKAKGVLDQASVQDGLLFIQSHWGEKKWLEIKKPDGRLVAEIQLPDCCSLLSAELLADSKRVEVVFSSAVIKQKKFIYDLETADWTDPRLEQKMMRSGKYRFVTETVSVRAQDGALIPMRITRRADLTPNRERPVYFQVYGGFNISGYLDPGFSPVIREYIHRGGILAGPALRGGNEFGKAWHQDGIAEKKVNTLTDLASSAKWFIENRWSQPSKIITTGTSNGGFVVAASSLLAPELFGLVIPIAGVLDLQRFPTLDPRFGSHWTKDYGNPNQDPDRQWIAAISPVRLAETVKPPKMLVIHGINDSRVNVQHSRNFIETLESSFGLDHVRSVHLRNAGHWQESYNVQNIIAWRTEVLRWSAIYDHLGWKFPQAAQESTKRP